MSGAPRLASRGIELATALAIAGGALALASAGWWAGSVAARQAVDEPARPHEYIQVIDDFEATALDRSRWPAVEDMDGEANGEYFWGISGLKASHGQSGLWFIGDGKDGRGRAGGQPYPCGVRSRAVLQLDLTAWNNPNSLELRIDYWLNLRTTNDSGVVPDGLFVNYLRPREGAEPERVVLEAVTAAYPERFWETPIAINLKAARDAYSERTFDLTRQIVLLEFLVKTKDPPCTAPNDGVFIDNLRLVADAPPGEAPTETPMPSATPTITLTPTRPRPTAIGPTETPVPKPIYMPYDLRNFTLRRR